MTISPSRVRLPSISELTSQTISYVPSVSPTIREEESSFKPASPNNYVLGTPNLKGGPVSYSAFGSYDRPIIPSNTLTNPQIPPPHQCQIASVYPSPIASYQSYPYVQYPASTMPSQSMRVPPGQAGSPTAPVYYQPVYLQPSRSSATGSQYAFPEVINKPNNKCHRCGTSETPEWRRGPNGVRTLCNACGLFHAKLVKRKGAALAAEEVLNNKVCKGKNGRRISIKKHNAELKDQQSPIIGTNLPNFPVHSTVIRP